MKDIDGVDTHAHCWMRLSRASSYDFQAPEMYEKAGFKRMAEFKDWPEGHVNVVLCKILADRDE